MISICLTNLAWFSPLSSEDEWPDFLILWEVRSMLDQWQHKRRRPPTTSPTQYTNRPTTQIKGGVLIISPPDKTGRSKSHKDRHCSCSAHSDNIHSSFLTPRVVGLHILPIWGETPTELIWSRTCYLHGYCRPRHNHVCTFSK